MTGKKATKKAKAQKTTARKTGGLATSGAPESARSSPLSSSNETRILNLTSEPGAFDIPLVCVG
jgi:hypothetical protein